MSLFQRTIVVVVLCAGGVYAEAPELDWERTYPGDRDVEPFSVIPTSDGGYLLAGRTTSFEVTGYHLYLLKTEPNGVIEWYDTFGGDIGAEGYSAIQCADGGYAATGHTWTDEGVDVYLLKTDPNGQKLWDRNIGTTDTEKGSSIRQTDDGGYIIGGSTWVRAWRAYLLKVDPNGYELWNRVHEVHGYTDAQCVAPCRDGGYVLTGATDATSGGRVVYLLKTGPDGYREWAKTYSGFCVKGNCVWQTRDGGFIISGSSSYGVVLIKTDASGNLDFYKTHGQDYAKAGNSVRPTDDGGYIVSTTGANAPGSGFLICLLKTDARGQRQWSRIFSGERAGYGYSAVQSLDGGYVIAGVIQSEDKTRYEGFLGKVRCEAGRTGDIDGDCDIDEADFVLLGRAWLTSSGQAGWDDRCDLGQPADGRIDVLDLAILTQEWLIGGQPLLQP